MMTKSVQNTGTILLRGKTTEVLEESPSHCHFLHHTTLQPSLESNLGLCDYVALKVSEKKRVGGN
jgi:hypothetical protein